MAQLSELKPIKHIALPDLGDLQCRGLVLIVGPNSSGKSQFLRDIHLTIGGSDRQLVVATNVEIDRDAFNGCEQLLLDADVFQSVLDSSGAPKLRPRSPYLGTAETGGEIPVGHLAHLLNNWNPNDPPGPGRRNFLDIVGKHMVTALFLERRLTSGSAVGAIDHQAQLPSAELHSLRLNDSAQSSLYEEIDNTFGMAVWLDQIGSGTKLCFRVGPVTPSEGDRLSAVKMSEYRTIDEEGDGLKSYVAICMSLLLGQRPVCLIDEPEMCLHPPQSYSLGRFIGKTCETQDIVTFVATHSSHVLRGVIQETQNVQIVRLTRRGDSFCAHHVSPDTLASATKRPFSRAETVLDGIFAESVIIVEADGDRLVYQTVWESLSDELPQDVHFTALGGTGEIADTCGLYHALQIPTAVIADIDVINDPSLLRRILKATGATEQIDEVVSEARSIMRAVLSLPPKVTTQEVSERLRKLADSTQEWEDERDIALSRKLRDISDEVNRMRRLKHGGIEAFEDETRNNLDSLVIRLKSFGVFLVPVGELEGWLKDKVESRKSKWAWASAAAAHVQSTGKQPGDVWDFVREVGSYLADEEPDEES